MFSYESGVFVSLLFYFHYVFTLLQTVNSLTEKNLNKVGERHSWLSLKTKYMEGRDFDMSISRKVFKFFVCALWHLIFVLLSWVGVALSVFSIVNKIRLDSGVPVAIKEFRWKLRNVDLEFDELVVEIIKAKGLSIEDFESIREELTNFVESRRCL